MNQVDLARLWVRFKGAPLAIRTVDDGIDPPPYLRSEGIRADVPGADEVAARGSATLVPEFAVQPSVAPVLRAKTDRVTSVFTNGDWRKGPNEASEPTSITVTPPADAADRGGGARYFAAVRRFST